MVTLNGIHINEGAYYVYVYVFVYAYSTAKTDLWENIIKINGHILSHTYFLPHYGYCIAQLCASDIMYLTLSVGKGYTIFEIVGYLLLGREPPVWQGSIEEFLRAVS